MESIAHPHTGGEKFPGPERLMERKRCCGTEKSQPCQETGSPGKGCP